MSRITQYDYYTMSHYCQDAIDITGHDGLCTECPFGDCIQSMNYGEKLYVLQAPVIAEVYRLHDAGNSAEEIAASLHLHYNRVIRWLKRRKSIEPKIRLYPL